PLCWRSHSARWWRCAWVSRLARHPLDWWRVNDDSAGTRTKRDAERACRPCEKARDQRAAGNSDRQEERRDRALRPLHAFPYPAWYGIGLPVLLPQLGVWEPSTLSLLVRRFNRSFEWCAWGWRRRSRVTRTSTDGGVE